MKMTPMDQVDPCVEPLIGKSGSERFQRRKTMNMKRTREKVQMTALIVFCKFVGGFVS